MADYNKPIPKTDFPYGLIITGIPSAEPLVYLDDDFECDSAYYYHCSETGGRPVPGSSPSIMARKTVKEMLHKAEDLLPEGYHLKILDAYRPVAVQQFLWDFYRARFRGERPDASDEELDEYTRTCVSMPSYNVLQPAIHNTGGAVDLTVTGPDGLELDMGTALDEFCDATWTNAFEEDSGSGLEDPVVRDNRRMLYSVMTEAGFTNLPSEWWHFDYGDGMWAQLKNENAIYAGILDAEVRDSVPYDNMELVRKADREQQELLARQREVFDACAEIAGNVRLQFR